MKLGTEIGHGPDHTVLDGDPAILSKRGSPQFSAYVLCGQTAGWIKMPGGMEVDLVPGDNVTYGTPFSQKKAGTAPPSNFGPCLLWPNR